MSVMGILVAISYNDSIMQKSKKLLTIAEAAEILHVHSNTLRKWDASGYLKAVRFGVRRDRRYRREDIDKLSKKKGQ